MKFYFLPALMLVCTCSFAQQPVLTNDLNTDMDAIVKKHIPCSKDGMLYSNYLLDPVQFNEKLEQTRNEAYRQIKPGNTEETILKHLDADYYLRDVLSGYNTKYGKDSAGFKALTDMFLTHIKDPQFFKDSVQLLMDAIKKSTVKQMDPAQKSYVDSLIYSNTDLNNAVLFRRSAAYREWIEAYLKKMYATKYKSDTTFKHVKGGMPISVVSGEIQDPFIREYECYVHSDMDFKVAKDSALIKKIYEDFNAAVTNAYYKGEMQKLYDNYERMHTANAPAPDFTYTAVDGKSITLSGLRGKYVYIDTWATWCEPCKAEIPFLVKIEEAYKGKNIAFVSLSVDRQADAGKWRKYVTDNKLTGVQVMADKDFQSDFVQKFNIASVPRFILIDPAGNVVDADAKRPSDPALTKQFDGLLK